MFIIYAWFFLMNLCGRNTWITWNAIINFIYFTYCCRIVSSLF